MFTLPPPVAPQILIAGMADAPALGWLREAGYAVRSAGSALAALRLATGLPRPDLVLVNEVVGEQDGLELVRRLQADPLSHDLPVLFAGGAELPMDEELALAIGAADCLALPLRPLVLLARVRNLLRPTPLRDDGTACAGVGALVRLVQLRDAGLARHLAHTREVARLLVRRARDDGALAPQLAGEHDAAAVVEAAALHDLGMVGLPDDLLHKAGPFSAAEAAAMRQHVPLGAEIVERAARDLGRPSVVLQRAWEVARWHHEQWDGGGYPDGLAGDAIPLSARIVALADAWAEMTQPRWQAGALAPAAARQRVLAGAGRQFDPRLARLVEVPFEGLANLPGAGGTAAWGTA